MTSDRAATKTVAAKTAATETASGAKVFGETVAARTAATEPAIARVALDITGMTCASCATRIERKLNRLDGVTAMVNYATEQASVEYPRALSPQDLVAVVEAAGYRATVPAPRLAPDAADAAEAVVLEQSGPVESASDQPTDSAVQAASALLGRLTISAVLALPVLLMAMVPALQFRNWQWLSLTLAAPVVVWGGWPFHRAAITNLRHGAATMDTLISLGTLAAFTWSLYALFFGDAGQPGMRMPFELITSGSGTDAIYLEVASVVVVFILAGRYFEARAKRRSGAALRALLHLGAKDVAVLRDDREIRIPIGQLARGDLFVVRPGEKVATDGVVVEGRCAIDASLLTGESVPVEVGPGDAVTGATVNAGGRIVARATRIGAETQLAQIARLVVEAQTGKAAVQRLADRVSAVFVPIVIVLAVATLVGWLLAGEGTARAFTSGVAVLIIACPCALGLATPTALLVGTGRGAQLGILIKGPEVLESTRRVDTIVLDKTGTVTTGEMTLLRIVLASVSDGEAQVPGEAQVRDEARVPDEAQVLRLAGAVESASEHPIARAVAKAAADFLGVGALPRVDQFSNTDGLGVEGLVDGRDVLVGRPRLLIERGIMFPADLDEARVVAEAEGATAVAVAWNGATRAILVVGDVVKPGSADAVARLRALGLRPILLTGDNARAARRIAEQVGIHDGDVIAEVLPAEKAEHVKRLQAEGRTVAMVGDGVNDAAALAQADLGLAMGTGADAAIEAADLTLVGGDPRGLPDAIRLSRRTLATIKGNLFWAFAYNVAALPLAAAGLLGPLIAGAAMAGSSVFVVSNSLRLRRFS